MGFFDDIFGDPEKQFKKDIERWKKEDEAWMEEIRKDDDRWRRAGGDPELYDAMKACEDAEAKARKDFEAMERHRQSTFSGGGGFSRFMDGVSRAQNRAYSRAMDRDADRIVRELERESRKYD